MLDVSVKHQDYLPEDVANLLHPQTDIPRIAKDQRLVSQIEAAVAAIPTRHRLLQGDARDLSGLDDNSVHLVVTSPPYWTLKKYRDHESQLGAIADYNVFLQQLDEVWKHCFRVLVPGGRLVCVAGDVCLSRRKNGGRHKVIPLHSSIQERCRDIGFDNLTPRSSGTKSPTWPSSPTETAAVSWGSHMSLMPLSRMTSNFC